MDKKLKGAVVALIGSLCYGGAQLMDIEARITALEDAHPELVQEELDEIAEELQSEEEPAEGSLSDEDKIEAEEAEAEAQPLIEATEEG